MHGAALKKVDIGLRVVFYMLGMRSLTSVIRLGPINTRASPSFEENVNRQHRYS